MSTTYADALKENAATRTQRPVWLARVYYSATLYKPVTNFNRPIVFPSAGAETFNPRPMEFRGQVKLDATGEDTGFDIVLGDGDRYWRALASDWNQRSLWVFRADADHLGSLEHAVTQHLFVEAFEFADHELVLHVGSFRALMRKRGPTVKVTRSRFPGLPVR